jgi:hypothetical protein
MLIETERALAPGTLAVAREIRRQVVPIVESRVLQQTLKAETRLTEAVNVEQGASGTLPEALPQMEHRLPTHPDDPMFDF